MVVGHQSHHTHRCAVALQDQEGARLAVNNPSGQRLQLLSILGNMLAIGGAAQERQAHLYNTRHINLCRLSDHAHDTRSQTVSRRYCIVTAPLDA